MKQVKINGQWVTPPSNVKEWLNEIVSVKLDDLLCPAGYIFRWQTIEAIRDSPRHKEKKVLVTH